MKITLVGEYSLHCENEKLINNLVLKTQGLAPLASRKDGKIITKEFQ
jgi:hypothetical protein